MKRQSLVVFGLLALSLLGCGDKVSDPEALYQKYLEDNAARQAKLKECSLMSVDEQLKSQTCTIAAKAAAKKGGEDFGRALKGFGKHE
ncbi:MAG: hypothetical protein A4E65_03082 [Syntrophorhabdus sp. PtaU1.Bin153]|nr:MAG: hypothetical protein A4E65_03082 [Syntrophorhabdus sp. PtaU1.Bin153]